MNIHSLENQSFGSNREKYISGYNPRRNPRHNIDAIINMDDRTIRQIASIKTDYNVEDSKHKKISKYILAAVPFAAGIASALLTPAKSSVLGKNISGTSARLLNGAKSTAFWGVLFGVAGAVSEGRNFLEKKSPEFENLTKKNPLLTFLGSVAAFAGILALGTKAIPKVMEFAGKYIDAKAVDNLGQKIVNTSKRFNNNKFIKTITKNAKDIKDSKYFTPLKGIVKTAIDWAPMTLLWGSIIHEFNHRNVKRQEFEKNYSEIKDYQHKLAKARIRELSLQNDFLMQDIKNQEDIKLIKTPLADIN